MAQWLTIKNWSEFQHYKDRNPPWIKLHRALLDDYAFAALPDAQKAHLVLLWLFAASQYAQEIAVESPAFDTDIGWWWVRGVGRIAFDDRKHLTAIQEAQADAVHAARKGDQVAYAAAQAKEKQAREAMQWPQ